MKIFRYDEALQRQCALKLLVFVIPISVTSYLFVETLELNKLFNLAIILIAGGVLNWPIYLMPHSFRTKESLELKINKDGLRITIPDEYEFSRAFSEITDVSKISYFNLPIIKLTFRNSEVIHLVGMQSSERLFQILTSR